MSDQTSFAPQPGPRLRIAITSFYLPSESKIGAGWMSHRLANALTDAGHEVTMFSPSRCCDDARYAHVQVEITGRLRIVKWAWRCRRLPLEGFDALIAQGDDHLVKRNSVPVHVRTLHGSCFDEARHAEGLQGKARMLFLGLTEALSALRTPIVVGVSQNSIRRYPWCDRVIPNGIDTQVFHPSGERRAAQPTVLFVGTYERRKRGKLLMKVFDQEVRPAIPDAQLWMVCSDAPTAPGVEVLGILSDAELAERYRQAWVFCLPSTYEGFGVPYAEALASGTPVVATPNPGACEVLARGGGVQVDDTELGAALVTLLADADLRVSLGERAVEASARYDIRHVAETYTRLIAEARPGRTPSVLQRLRVWATWSGPIGRRARSGPEQPRNG